MTRIAFQKPEPFYVDEEGYPVSTNPTWNACTSAVEAAASAVTVRRGGVSGSGMRWRDSTTLTVTVYSPSSA